MVQDRREPTMNSIKPERDEIAHHQGRPSSKAGAASAPRRAPPPPPKRFPAGMLALFIALIACGATGFSYWQLQQTQQVLVVAEKRIASLESQLNITSGESLESLGNVNEKLEWADSEIRKLWGVAYDTNRNTIKANKDDIASVAKLAKDATDGVVSQKSTLAALQALSNEQQLILSKVREDDNLQDMDITKALNLAEQLEQDLKKLGSDLPGKVAAHEEAIAAIDTFRRSVNADLLKIKQQLGQTP